MIFLQKLKSFFLFIFLSTLIVFSSSNKIIADESNNNLLWTTSAGSYSSERFFSGSQITSNNIKDLDKFLPENDLMIEIIHPDGTKDDIFASHTYNDNQIEWFKAGSSLNLIANK